MAVVKREGEEGADGTRAKQSLRLLASSRARSRRRSYSPSISVLVRWLKASHYPRQQLGSSPSHTRGLPPAQPQPRRRRAISTYWALCDAGRLPEGGERTVAAQSLERNRHCGAFSGGSTGRISHKLPLFSCSGRVWLGAQGRGQRAEEGEGRRLDSRHSGSLWSLAIADVARCGRPIKGWRRTAFSGVFSAGFVGVFSWGERSRARRGRRP